MQIRNRCFIALLFQAFEVPVHERDTHEESEVVTLEISEDFNHPVDHSGSESAVDLVTLEHIRKLVESLRILHVAVDVSAVLKLNMFDFPFYLCQLSSLNLLRLGSCWPIDHQLEIGVLLGVPTRVSLDLHKVATASP